MRYNKKFLGLFCSATFCLLFLSLVACGDGDNKVIEVYDDTDQVLAAGKKLSAESCDTSAVVKKVFVADSGASYFCDGNDWVKLKGGAGDDGLAGSDGKDGASGEKGVKGDSAQIPGYTGPMGHVEIERTKTDKGNNTVARVFVARPGVVIGQDGKNILALKEALAKLIKNNNVRVEVVEVKNPDLDATIVAQTIAKQLEESGCVSRPGALFRKKRSPDRDFSFLCPPRLDKPENLCEFT